MVNSIPVGGIAALSILILPAVPTFQHSAIRISVAQPVTDITLAIVDRTPDGPNSHRTAARSAP